MFWRPVRTMAMSKMFLLNWNSHTLMERNTNSSTNSSADSNAEEDFFVIDQKEWQKKKTQKGRLFQGLQWTNVIATGIKSVHPFCILVFKKQSIKTSQSRTKAPVFSCTAYCRIQDCPVTMKVVGNDEKTLKCFSQEVRCATTQKNWKQDAVRGESRNVIVEKLEPKLPQSLYLDSHPKIPEQEAECRDEAPSKDVL